MGKDFSYKIVDKQYDPSLIWSDDFKCLWTLEGQDNLFNDGQRYTRDEMYENLREYVANRDNFNNGEEFETVLEAFGHIIAEMDDDSLVIIHYC